MRIRTLGKTGIKVSTIGFGAWQLGNNRDFGPMTEDEALTLVHTALDRGCLLFDTAPNYGLGTSETLLGKALKGRRDAVVISSKFGHHATGVMDYDAAKMTASVEGSLGRLQTDHLDVLLLHNPPLDALNGDSPQFQMMRKLQQQGKIRFYGASVDWSREVLALLNTNDAQVIELLFNIVHQEPASTFEQIAAKEVGVIVKVPLDSGWLAGRYQAHTEFTGVRARWSPAVVARRAEVVERIRTITHDNSHTHAALRFVLAFPAISAVIPGVRNVDQLTENLAAGDRAMPPPTVQQLRDFWHQNLERDPLPW